MSTNVVKRNGSVESLNLEKIHKMVEMACDGVAGVSESAIEMNANLQILMESRPMIYKRSLSSLQTI